MPQPRKHSKITTEEVTALENASVAVGGIPAATNQDGSAVDSTMDVCYPVSSRPAPTQALLMKTGSRGASTRSLGTPSAAASTPDALEEYKAKPLYDGGFHMLPRDWHAAWKPKRAARDLEPLPEQEAGHWKEDLIYFKNAEGKNAVINTVEDLVSLCISIPAPYELFDTERFFLFPSGSNITWEDPVFFEGCSIKFEMGVNRMIDNPALGTESFLTLVGITTNGESATVNEDFDIRGLRITRKKQLVVEFWVGRKGVNECSSPAPSTMEAPLTAPTVEAPAENAKLSEETMLAFMDFVKDKLSTEFPTELRFDIKLKSERFSS